MNMTETLVPSAVSPVGVNRGGNSGPQPGDTAVRAGNSGSDSISRTTSALSPGSARPVPGRQKALGDRPARTTEGITSRQQRFLDAAATLTTLNVEVTRETVSAWVGVHPRGGSVGEELKVLVDAGMIELDRGAIRVTSKGMQAGGTVDSQDAIVQAQRGLSPRQRRIFDIILSVHPDAITREAIAESMGIHPRGGSFGEDLGRLRGRGLIEYERGSARARDFLFAGVV